MLTCIEYFPDCTRCEMGLNLIPYLYQECNNYLLNFEMSASLSAMEACTAAGNFEVRELYNIQLQMDNAFLLARDDGIVLM